MAVKNPEIITKKENTHMFLVKTMITTGNVVPMTVAIRHLFLPISSLNLPKNGHAMKLNTPLQVSTNPTTK